MEWLCNNLDEDEGDGGAGSDGGSNKGQVDEDEDCQPMVGDEGSGAVSVYLVPSQHCTGITFVLVRPPWGLSERPDVFFMCCCLLGCCVTDSQDLSGTEHMFASGQDEDYGGVESPMEVYEGAGYHSPSEASKISDALGLFSVGVFAILWMQDFAFSSLSNLVEGLLPSRMNIGSSVPFPLLERLSVVMVVMVA